MAQLLQELWLITNISRFFGVLHVFIVKNGAIQISKLSKSLSLFYFTLYTLTLFEIVGTFYKQSSRAAILVVASDAFNTIQYLVVNFIQSEYLKNTINKIFKVDLMLNDLKKTNSSSVFKYTMLFISYILIKTVLTATLIRITETYSVMHIVSWNIFTVLTSLIITLSESFFVIFVFLIYQKFKQINAMLDLSSKKHVFGKFYLHKYVYIFKTFYFQLLEILIKTTAF